MKLTDEQIKSIMQKEIKSKTILVSFADVQTTIIAHQKDGWELIKKSELNGRIKLTFKK